MSATDAVKAEIIAELKRQAPDVYFWDRADEALFEDGRVFRNQFGTAPDIFSMADKFDMNLVAAAAVKACQDWLAATVNTGDYKWSA